MSYHVLFPGAYRICALTKVGDTWEVTCPAVEFLQQQAAIKSYSSMCKGFAVIFGRYAMGGRQAITAEMFHEVDKPNGIWQFIKGDLRLLCFVEKNDVFITDGYVKKSQKADRSEVARAVAAKNNYFKK
jgi:hypothetical protein